MRRIVAVVVAFVFLSLTSYSQFLETTKRIIPTPVDQTSGCLPPVLRPPLAFDFEPLRQEAQYLDIATFKTIWATGANGLGYLWSVNENAAGIFGSPIVKDFAFLSCNTPIHMNRFLFGNLRPNVVPKEETLLLCPLAKCIALTFITMS